MNLLDYVVLLGTIISIAAYGAWHTRGTRSLTTYFKGDQRATGWGTIGISVMATQASAITFLSIPGQGYESGLGFVQNYFGLPLALIIISAVFLPIYRKLNVYTAYEYLGRRFDGKTRLLGAALFLVQRGLATGVTIYAPAIILSTVLGWQIDVVIIVSGLLVIVYTVTGGSEAVNITQRWQMGVIFAGMLVAFVVLLMKLPLSFGEAARVAGGFGKMQAVDFSFDPDRRYTLWTGLLGGLFLSLSYFGTDQSQVQRYLGGSSLRESRLGLMFNAILKIPMQFFILLLGALVFVFYQFEKPPIFFNRAAWTAQAEAPKGTTFRALDEKFSTLHEEKKQKIEAWLGAERKGDTASAASARAAMLETQKQSDAVRADARKAVLAADPRAQAKDSDYVFITFAVDYLPHGFVGLLVAVMIAAALSSKASELNALGTTTALDFYRHLKRGPADDAHYVKAAKWFTAAWGVFAIGFALFANFLENLIEAINILGSIFYGVVLGIFLVAFFLRRIGGTAVFAAALIAQVIVIALYFSLTISYLWYNLIGCALCVVISLILQPLLGGPRANAPAAEVA
jgi:Na+/proline symporter